MIEFKGAKTGLLPDDDPKYAVSIITHAAADTVAPNTRGIIGRRRLGDKGGGRRRRRNGGTTKKIKVKRMKTPMERRVPAAIAERGRGRRRGGEMHRARKSARMTASMEFENGRVDMSRIGQEVERVRRAVDGHTWRQGAM